MCFGTVLDHLETILVHFQPNLKIEIFSRFRPFWAILGPFGAHFGPFWAPFGPPKRLGSPKSEGETRPKWAKGGSTGHKNVFLGPF